MTGNAKTAVAASVAVPQSDAANLFRRAGRALARAYQVRKSRAALGALSDETLRDIGVARCEIDFLAESLVNAPTRQRG
jgi:uncharacterized protein YjiS (DUF1127 family)